MINLKKFGYVLLCMAAGFAGGLLSNGFFRSTVSYAQAVTERQQIVVAEEFQLVDNKGNVTGRWTNCEGMPCMNLYDTQGKVRLQAGVYGDGMPFVGLFDAGFQAKGLFRLAGNDDAPVLVFKRNGQDRIILGMDLADATEPFLSYVDASGQRHLVFGKN